MAIEILLSNKNVAFGALGELTVPFLQNHNCVPHVAVHKLNLEVGTVCLSSPEPIYRVPESCQSLWEVYLIDLGLPGGGVRSLHPSPLPLPV